MKTEVTLCGTVLIKITPEMIEAGALVLGQLTFHELDGQDNCFKASELVLKAALGVEDD